jgi:hypothetical protein
MGWNKEADWIGVAIGLICSDLKKCADGLFDKAGIRSLID